MKNILFLCICIFLFGCNKPLENTFNVSGLISNTNLSEIKLETSDSTYLDSVENGKFSFTIPLSTESYASLEIGEKIPLYVKAGDSIFIDYESSGNWKITGKGCEETCFLQEKANLINELGFDDPRKVDIALFSSAPASFQAKIDSIKQIRINQLDAYKKQHPTLSVAFYDVESQLANYFEINQLFGYLGFHEMLTKNKPELPAGYYDFTKRINLGKKGLYPFREYKSAIKSFLDYKTQTLNEKYILAKEMVSDNKFFEEIMFDQFNSYISFNGIDGIDSICADFIKTIGNNERGKALARKYYNWKKLGKGEKAPEFSIKDSNGKTIHLSDFKGKYVYIDCWNTYCGPCLAEMPEMKKLADEMKGKNIVFISISSDNDKDRWLAKTKEFNINTINLCTEGANHQFNEDYNAKAFPRYILIDDKGYIVDATADKPSLIKGELEKLL